MEGAPLVLAHTHARNALLEVQKTNPIAASEEHDLAAGEFATAASTSADTEAIRILRLLEQHHQKLAEILKIKPGEAPVGIAASATSQEDNSPQDSAKIIDSPSRHSHFAASMQQRNPTSSIASNLASARGIPTRSRRGQHLPAQISTQNAEGRVLKPARRSNLGEHEMRASVLDEKDADGIRPRDTNGPPIAITTRVEDPFSRFYSTFGNIISTLSAPLAFAGLPLNNEASVADLPSKPASPVASRVAADPDLARYFSKAALRAVRDERGGFAPAESFYVVPTSGGTMSYAGMLSNTRQSSNVTEEDDAEFVDASETPQPPSPGIVRTRRSHRESNAESHGFKSNKTWEEMMVENETLKAVALDLGERLRAFELGAQRSSRALHASVRGLSSPSSSVMPPMPGVEGMKLLQDKLRDNEEELKTLRKENKRLTRENTKFMSVIERYRERWEVLKEGARERVRGDVSSTKRRVDTENSVGSP